MSIHNLGQEVPIRTALPSTDDAEAVVGKLQRSILRSENGSTRFTRKDLDVLQSASLLPRTVSDKEAQKIAREMPEAELSRKLAQVREQRSQLSIEESTLSAAEKKQRDIRVEKTVEEFFGSEHVELAKTFGSLGTNLNKVTNYGLRSLKAENHKMFMMLFIMPPMVIFEMIAKFMSKTMGNRKDRPIDLAKTSLDSALGQVKSLISEKLDSPQQSDNKTLAQIQSKAETATNFDDLINTASRYALTAEKDDSESRSSALAKAANLTVQVLVARMGKDGQMASKLKGLAKIKDPHHSTKKLLNQLVGKDKADGFIQSVQGHLKPLKSVFENLNKQITGTVSSTVKALVKPTKAIVAETSKLADHAAKNLGPNGNQIVSTLKEIGSEATKGLSTETIAI